MTAGVTRTSLLTAQVADGLRVDRFSHPPGGHTRWHVHTGNGPWVHLAVTAGGDTIWLGEVTPDEYDPSFL